MRQQINLYQPIFHKQRKLFSSRVVGAAFAAVILALVGIYAFGQWQVNAVAVRVDLLHKDQQANETRMTSLGTLQSARANTKPIEDKIAALSAELAVRTRALQALQAGAAGHTTGFASRLQALAHSQMDGVWLDHVVLASEHGAMSLSGGTMNPALVPRYLQRLSAEPALSGARFDEFVIEGRPTQKGGSSENEVTAKAPADSLRFRAGSSVVVNDKAADAT